MVRRQELFTRTRCYLQRELNITPVRRRCFESQAAVLTRGSCALILDHVFEVQMLHDHLKKNNIDFKSVFTFILLRHPGRLIIFLFRQMKPIHQAQIREILNGPSNMALIPGSINQSVRSLSRWQNILHMIHFISEGPVD